MPEIIIRNDRTGEEYGIDSAKFRSGKHYLDRRSGERMTYAEAGFKVVSNIDGTEYHGPLTETPRPTRAAAPAAEAPKDSP